MLLDRDFDKNSENPGRRSYQKPPNYKPIKVLLCIFKCS